MAEQSLTTPGAVSRRFLFSAAVALPVATATAGSSPGGVSPRLLALLERYRDTCIRLREVEADQAEKLLSIPACIPARFLRRQVRVTMAGMDAGGTGRARAAARHAVAPVSGRLHPVLQPDFKSRSRKA